MLYFRRLPGGHDHHAKGRDGARYVINRVDDERFKVSRLTGYGDYPDNPLRVVELAYGYSLAECERIAEEVDDLHRRGEQR